MDQLICASLSHTHHWYEVGMLKISADLHVIIYCWRGGTGLNPKCFYYWVDVQKIYTYYYSDLSLNAYLIVIHNCPFPIQ